MAVLQSLIHVGADPITRQPILFDRGGGIDHVLLEQAHRTEDGVEVVNAGEEAVAVVVVQSVKWRDGDHPGSPNG